jgi:hypothetical protein
MSFTTNEVWEKAGSAGLKRDGSVARKHLRLGPRRNSVARVPAAMFVWLSASSGPRAYQVCRAAAFGGVLSQSIRRIDSKSESAQGD